MATANFFIEGKNEPKQIKVRYINGKAVDVESGINIFVKSNNWDKANQRIRNVIEVPDRDKINLKLSELKSYIFNCANSDFMEGEILDTFWLKKTIAKFMKRPAQELKKAPEPYKIYFTDFADWWLLNKAAKHKVKTKSGSKFLDSKTINHYKKLNTVFKKFQGKTKVKLKEITSDLMDEFAGFLISKDLENYARATAERMLVRFKFFCSRAEEENLDINKQYKASVVFEIDDEEESGDYKHPYLDEIEINKIYQQNFSYDPELDNARDNFIIGLWTGLRVSDFLTRLNISNFDDGYIEIKTQKTKTFVTIPVHWMIKEIIKKRNGQLPTKISDVKFNLEIKRIGRRLKFFNEMMGGISVTDEKKIKRKVVGLYPKYKLMTSHICRRSFATNVYGTVPDNTLMAICGWKSKEQMLDYIKKTNREHAETLKKVWDSKYKNVN